MCIPGACLIGIVLTLAASILFDFDLQWDSIGVVLMQLLPGFVVGMLIMMAIGRFVGSLLLGLLRLVGIARR